MLDRMLLAVLKSCRRKIHHLQTHTCTAINFRPRPVGCLSVCLSTNCATVVVVVVVVVAVVCMYIALCVILHIAMEILFTVCLSHYIHVHL